jgi:uncharacterized membrane protein YjjB (DUF3815 family)
MKTLHIVSTLAALSALGLALSFGFEATISVLFAAGLVGILAADYAHIVRPAPLQLAPVVLAIKRSEHFRLAA